MNIREVFEDQAETCKTLGSPFTALLLRLANGLLAKETPVGHHIRNWQGDPSTGADSVPLRLAGALHSLVLTGKSPELARLYPPQCHERKGVADRNRSGFYRAERPYPFLAGKRAPDQ